MCHGCTAETGFVDWSGVGCCVACVIDGRPWVIDRGPMIDYTERQRARVHRVQYGGMTLQDALMESTEDWQSMQRELERLVTDDEAVLARVRFHAQSPWLDRARNV